MNTIAPYRHTMYPLRLTLHALSAQSPLRVLPSRFPFGQSPSLHLLRHWYSSFVRRLRGYYGSVRLPTIVHHRRTSLDFPMRSDSIMDSDDHGISRFSRGWFMYVLRVSDRVGPNRISLHRPDRYCLPKSPTPSATKRKFISRLNTWPIHPFVNASRLNLQTAPHNSSPAREANPFRQRIFQSATNPPVYPGARRSRDGHY